MWGRLLRTGYQTSRYGHQIERYACLYTAHSANLGMYCPEHSFRGRVDLMAHEAAPRRRPGDGGGDDRDLDFDLLSEI